MKKRKPFIAILVFIIAVAAALPSRGEIALDFFEHPDAVRANYIEEKYLPTLSEPVRSEGEFIYLKNKGLAWLMEKPFAMQTVITPSGLSQWIDGEKLEQSQATQRSMKPILSHIAAIFSGDQSALEEQFSIKQSADETGFKTMTLEPKSSQLKAFLQGIEIQGFQHIETVKIIFSADKYTLVRYSTIESGEQAITEQERALFEQ